MNILNRNILNIYDEKNRGKLLPISFSDIPFVPQRIFVVTDVPPGETRGYHAHHQNQQVLVIVKGKIRIMLDNGHEKRYIYAWAGDSVFHSEMEWAEITFMNEYAILMSICSMEYDEKDYIKDYLQFLKLVGNNKIYVKHFEI